MMQPTDIIRAIDDLPQVDQGAVIDALIPDTDGSYSNVPYNMRHGVRIDMRREFEDLREEAITATFNDRAQLHAELVARLDDDDELFDLAVRLILDLPHDAAVSRGTMAQAAKNLLDALHPDSGMALKRASTMNEDAELVPERLFGPAYKAVEELEEHLHNVFEWNGDFHDLEQVRQWMPRFLAVWDDCKQGGHTYDANFLGKIPGIAGAPHESRGIYLLQGLKRRDDYRAQVAALEAEGFTVWANADSEELDNYQELNETMRGHVFGKWPEIAVCTEGGSTGGGDRIERYEDARIVFVRATRSDIQLTIMKPRQRVNGQAVPHSAVIYTKGNRA